MGKLDKINLTNKISTLVMVFLLIAFTLIPLTKKNTEMEIVYSTDNINGMAQLFWTSEDEAFSQANSVKFSVIGGVASVELPQSITTDMSLRLDFINKEMSYGIECINFYSDENIYYSINGEELKKICVGEINIKESYVDGGTWVIDAETTDSFVFLGSELCDEICEGNTIKYGKTNVLCSVILLIIYLIIINRKKIQNNEVVSVLLGWFLVIVLMYGVYIVGDKILTTTNLMYNRSPWNSMWVNTYGPELSDPVDAYLPQVYNSYYSGKDTSWISNIAFGTSVDYDVTMNPINWVVFSFPLEIALLIKAIIETSLAYFGMYFLCKKLDLTCVSRIFSGITYSMSSAMVMWLFWQHTDVMAIAPWTVLVGYNLVNKQRVRDMLWMALVVYFMMVSGMPPFAGYVLYLVGFMILITTIMKYNNYKSIFKTYFLFGCSAIIGIVMSLSYLMNILNQVVDNGYADSRKGKARDVLNFSYVRTMFAPYNREELGMHVNESTIFVGIVGVVLIAVCLVNIKHIKHKYWIGAMLTIILFVFTHVLDSVFALMPAINTSSKIRLINIFVFVLCIIMGQGLDLIIKKDVNLQTVYSIVKRCIIYCIIIGWITSYMHDASDFLKDNIRLALIYIIITIALVELLVFVKKNNIKLVVLSVLIVINIINMQGFAKQYLPGIDGSADVIPVSTDTIQYLKQNTESERIYILGVWNLFPNTNVFYDLNCITSHSVTNTNTDNREFLLRIDDEMDDLSRTAFQGVGIDNYNLLKWAGVKYIVKPQNYDYIEIDDYEVAYSGNDGLDVYKIDDYNSKLYLSEEIVSVENADVMLDSMEKSFEKGKVYIEQSEGIESSQNAICDVEDLIVLEDNEDYIKTQVNLEDGRILVLNECNDGKWEVYVDGTKKELLKVNYLFKGVYLSSGEHIVEFKHNNITDIVMLGVAVCLLIVIIICLVGIYVKEFKQIKNKENDTNEINNPNTML